jgi:hypothetical protein
VIITVQPAIGPNGARRLKGCLEDATLNDIQASVRSITQIE